MTTNAKQSCCRGGAVRYRGARLQPLDRLMVSDVGIVREYFCEALEAFSFHFGTIPGAPRHSTHSNSVPTIRTLPSITSRLSLPVERVGEATTPTSWQRDHCIRRGRAHEGCSEIRLPLSLRLPPTQCSYRRCHGNASYPISTSAAPAMPLACFSFYANASSGLRRRY